MTWTDEWLGATLSSLAAEIEWPDGPDLSSRVELRIASSRPSRRWRAPAWAAAVAVAVVFVITPPGQEAVAWLLRIGGLRVEFTESSDQPPPPTTLVGGTESSIAEAESTLGFELLAPQSLPPPDSVQLLHWGGGQQAAMLWAPSDDLPEVFESGTGLLFVQFRARVDEQLLLKEASSATRVEPVEVGGGVGYYFSEAPHTVYFEGPDGAIVDDQFRLAGNVLVWTANGITYRIESALSLEEMLDLVESLG
jgi:hypothetical protein